MVLNVKAFLEKNGDVKGEIRRFQVPSGAAELYRLLSTKVADIFNLPENGFRMYWQGEAELFIPQCVCLCVWTRTERGGRNRITGTKNEANETGLNDTE